MQYPLVAGDRKEGGAQTLKMNREKKQFAGLKSWESKGCCAARVQSLRGNSEKWRRRITIISPSRCARVLLANGKINLNESSSR